MQPVPPAAPVPIDQKTIDKLTARILDAGVALAYNAKGTGIAAQWAAKLKETLRFTREVPTAAVTDSGVLANPDFIAGLNPGEAVFLLAHETMHVALGHMDLSVHVGVAHVQKTETGERLVLIPGKEREAKLLNWAKDAFINEVLLDSQLGAMPAGGITRKSFPAICEGKEYPDTLPFTSESMFFWLCQNAKQDPGGGGGGGGSGGGSGQPRPGTGCGPEGLPGKLDKVAQEQMRAAIREHALGRGTGTLLAEAMSPKRARVDWRSVLKTAFESANEDAEDRSERSFSRPSRREVDPDIISPGLIGTEARIAVIIDVSGSVGPDWAKAAASYTVKLLEDFPGTRVWLGTHADGTCWKGWLSPTEDTETIGKAVGFSGGTDCRETYIDAATAARERGWGKYDVLVHFTDGDLSWPDAVPARRWVVGQLVHPFDPPKGARLVPVTK